MLSCRICLLVTLGFLAILLPRPGGENSGVTAEVATRGNGHASRLIASPASVARAAPHSRTAAGGETGLHAAMAGPPAIPWAASAFGLLDGGVQREFLSVFVLVATVLAAMVITGRIRRSDPHAYGKWRPRADVTPSPYDTPPATRGSGN